MKGWAGKENRSLRQPVGDSRSPEVFLSYQQKWSADDNPVKVIEKSRRIGLSWGEAGEDSLLAASESGMDVFYIGYNKDMALEFIEDCGAWSKFYNQAAGEIEDFIWEDEGEEKKSIQAFRIRYPSGWKIVALSSRPANLRGKQGKIVIDEAAFHDDLPGLLKAAMAMLMWGGRVVVISTHNGDDHPFNELVSEIRAGKKPYSLHRVTIDDALKQGLYRRICLRLGKPWSAEAEARWRESLFDFYGDDADEELLCIPSKGGGAYLTRVMIEGIMSEDVPVLRWSPPAKDFVHWSDVDRFREMESWLTENLEPVMAVTVAAGRRSWFGEDFGRTCDLTVFWPLQDMPGLTYHTPFVLELRNCPFTQQEQTLFFFADRLPRLAGGALDKGGNGAFLAERAMQRYGEDRIEEVSLSQGWYLENMPPMKACFEDRTSSAPRDNEILEDFRAIKKIRGIPRVPTDERTMSKFGGKRHGDAAVAKCLAVFADRTIEYYDDVPTVFSAGTRSMVDQTTGFYNRPRLSAY
jgi:phage FluMu gp28-like protein